MLLQTLTPEQTDIWIGNLNKVINLRNAVKKYNNDDYERNKKIFDEQYGWLYKSWHGVHEYSQLYLGYDGYHHIPMAWLFSKVDKIGKVPPRLVDYKRVVRWEYANTRDTVLSRLKQKWERYATKPFDIHECDLEMYQNLFEWHEVLKNILVEGGVYDEAFDLDEDC